MRKPYDTILIVSVLLTILYFIFVDKPINPNEAEDRHDIIGYALVYLALLFGIISLARLYFKRRW